MKLDSFIRYGALALALALIPNYAQAEDEHSAGAVFTMDNAGGGNKVLAYHRAADGRLSPAGTIATGGLGTGGGLSSQAALILSRNGRWLFACNAGSDEISVFRVWPHGLQLTDKASSGGKRPISLALHGNLLYGLNAGGQAGDADNVTGFLFTGGKLYELPNSSRPLSGADTGPAQIGFSRGGEVLVVTEKATSILDTYRLDDDGLIDDHQQFASVGQTPFGFAFRRDHLLVSEAFGSAVDASAVSSYELDDDGDLGTVSPSVPTTETAACWVVVTRDGRFAYASNTGSGTISGYRVAHEGGLKLLNADGVTGNTGAGSRPIDMALSVNSRFLYVLNAGNGTIGAFRVNQNGSLHPITGVSGLPSGANGLAAR